MHRGRERGKKALKGKGQKKSGSPALVLHQKKERISREKGL